MTQLRPSRAFNCASKIACRTTEKQKDTVKRNFLLVSKTQSVTCEKANIVSCVHDQPVVEDVAAAKESDVLLVLLIVRLLKGN